MSEEKGETGERIAMSRQPLVSIVLPARNAAKTLPLAVESCLHQTLPDFELLLMDHHSEDETFSLMKKYARRDRRIQVLKAPRGAGFISALNFNWRESRGKYVARMDADDYAYPGRLQAQARFLEERPELAACGTMVRIRLRAADGAHGEPLPGYAAYEKWLNSVVKPEDIAAQRFIDSPVANPSMMIRREVLEKFGGYENHAWAEDYDLWLRMLGQGERIGKVSQVLLDWYDSAGRATRNEPRYEQDRFHQAKAVYLARLSQVMEKGVSVCGAGPIGKRLARRLAKEGIAVHRFFEVSERRIGNRIGGVPVEDGNDLEGGKGSVLIGAVGVVGGRDRIRQLAEASGFVEGEDFFCVA